MSVAQQASAAPPQSQTYEYQSAPRPVDGGQRRKYRDPAEAQAVAVAAANAATVVLPGRPNLMQDRRVVRGNTYAALIPTLAQRKLMEHHVVGAEAARKARLARTMKAKSRDMPANDDPAAVDGREHRNVQTDDFLEELADKIFEADVSTQTDSIDDRPPAPIFIPKKAGISKSTMINPGDLFDFDLGVSPILEVLVGKVLDQGLAEVLEEEELKRLEYTRLGFEQKRDQLIAEAQRLEEATRRRYEEKDRRVLQERARVAQEKVVATKLAAQTAARAYLADLHNTVIDDLQRAGTFIEPVVKQVATEFLPWLITRVVNELEQADQAQLEVNDIVTRAVERMIKQRDDKIEGDRLAAEAEAKRLHDLEVARLAAIAEAKRKDEEEKAAAAAREAELAQKMKEMQDKLDAEGDHEEGDDQEGDDDEPAAPKKLKPSAKQAAAPPAANDDEDEDEVDEV